MNLFVNVYTNVVESSVQGKIKKGLTYIDCIQKLYVKFSASKINQRGNISVMYAR